MSPHMKELEMPIIMVRIKNIVRAM